MWAELRPFQCQIQNIFCYINCAVWSEKDRLLADYAHGYKSPDGHVTEREAGQG